jgi:drug/metabolite transporter (DMT)-like permease
LINLVGASSAILGAILWAGSALIFENLSKKVPSARLNFYKGLIALVLLAGTSVILGERIPNINWIEISTLAISGVIGIALGDTAFFQAVKKVGARRSLTLFTLSPPMTALIALIFLGERLSLITWIGIMVTVGGVMWVVTEESGQEKIQIKKEDLLPGILFGALAALGQAIGVVMTRSVLTQTNLTTLQSTIVRLAPAMVALIIVIRILERGSEKSIKPGFDKKMFGMVLLSSIIGAYICLWLQQITIENLPAGIAQTMLSTSPIFILPMAAFRGEKNSIRAIIGAVLAIVGITLIFGLFG